VYGSFAARHPALLSWPDRRPIARLFLGGGLPEAAVLDYYRRGEKGPVPAADARFREEVLGKLDRAVHAARQIDAQGIIVWDIEGDALPHPTTYIGDPRLTSVLNPRMDAVADAYFGKIREAGLRCGVCIRPSRVVYAKDRDKMMQSFGAAKDPFLELDAKIEYCKRRWGCTLFYVDTNYFWRPRGQGGKWTPGMLAADVWRRLLRKHPKVLLIPEHNYVEYWACTAPYNELDCGYRGVPAWVRRVYPKAFCVAVIEDADPHENHDLLVQMVRDGDCLMTFTYGLTRNAEAIIHIYAEARILDAGEPASVARAGASELASLVAAGDLSTRFHAARRLGSHNSPQAVASLIARLEDPNENWLVRKNAVLSLGRLRARKAATVLGRLAKSRKPDLRHFATLALKEISKAVVVPAGLGEEPEGPGIEPLRQR
ncbi:MAG: HEAT repeat domain-containing protein, partial [Phycisphaerae bacterium]